MGIYRDGIRRILNELEDSLKQYTVEYGEQPDGHLICGMNDGKDQFMQVVTANGVYHRKCINRNPDLIRKLARKEFLEKSIEALENNIRILTHASENMASVDSSDILASMRKAYRRLPEDAFYDPGALPLFMCNEEVINRRIKSHLTWANSPYQMSHHNPEGRKKPTSQGLYVRSKSEQLIVEMLYRYGIPFRYEQVIPIGIREFSADFTFEAADGSEFYWEHAGMMDNPGYAENHLRKLISYQKVNILPGRNLLISYDRDGDLNMAIVESMVKNEVIPRL